MRRSVAAVCIACFAFPFTAGALGLGEIELESALNEPFAAGIPVTGSAAELDDLQVRLASGETFRRYGIDQPAFLQDFRFVAGRDADGSPVIRITSRNPVAEPFVTLLLDVQWGSGRLLREYTVLLDPPVYASEPVPVPVSPARTRAPASVPAPAPEPAVREVPPVTAAPRAAPAASLGDSYQVQQRDTLWDIAERARGDGGLTTNQVMLALYQANPDAFMGNINRLKAGSILRIPPATELAAIPAPEATAAVRQQNAQFAGAAADSPAAPADAVDAGSAPARLQLVPPRDTAADDAAPAGREQPQLEARTGDAAEAGQLRARLGELEQALSQSERLLQVRDSELQALQQRLAQLEQQLEAAGEAVPEPEPFADEVAQQPRLPLPGEESADGPASVSDAPVADAADEPVAPDAEPAADDTDAAPAAQSDARTVVTSPETGGSFIGDLFSNIWLWLSAAIVLVLALLVARRRRQSADSDQTGAWNIDADETGTAAAQDYEETMRDLQNLKSQDPSIVVEEQPGAGDTQRNEAFRPEADDEGLDFPADDAGKNPFIGDDDNDDAATAYGRDPDAELPLEKTISTGAPLNLDQADPIAEAEFHMAYGLYDQAAELLERSLRSDPDNRAYRVKLIEVYFVWENREGFLREARRLHEAVGDRPDSDWSKVLILGKQLCPDEPLFEGAAPTTADSMDFELDDASGSGDTELDFTLGGTEVRALDADAAADDSDNDGDALDIDFGDFGTGVSDKLELDLGEDSDTAGSDADTLETPTVEIDADAAGDGGTLESPTVENWFDDATVESAALQDDDLPPAEGQDGSADQDAPASDTAATTETPTLENPMNEPTLESPTLESLGAGGETSEMPALDIEDFDPEAIEFETGGADDLDVDLSGLGKDSADDTGGETDDAEAGDDDATLLAGLDMDFEALNEDLKEEDSSDTVEQPPVDASAGDTAEQPAISSSDDLDFNFDEQDPEEDMPTAIAPGNMLPEDATMTEVGTKLDLARAYIDMGDPDGARSILQEVLDEGGKEQQQQARQLLEELGN